MLARIAHELFWLGRNVARAEHTARMLDGVFQAVAAGPPRRPGRRHAGLELAAGDHGRRRQRRRGRAFAPRRGPARADARARQPGLGGGVRGARARGRAHACATSSRPRCGRRSTPPTSTLRERRPRAAACAGDPYSVYAYVKERCALFWGLTSRTMLRDEASALPRRRRADRVRPTWSCGCCASRCRPRPTTTSTRARPGARAAAGRRRLPGLPPRRARAAERGAGRALPALRARLPGLRRGGGRRRAQRARARRRATRATPSRSCACSA